MSSGQFTYFITAGDPANVVKIGKATNVERRIKSLQTGCPDPLMLIGLTRTSEAVIHRRFAHLRTHGEWFRMDTDLAEFIYGENARMGIKNSSGPPPPEGGNWNLEEIGPDKLATVAAAGRDYYPFTEILGAHRPPAGPVPVPPIASPGSHAPIGHNTVTRTRSLGAEFVILGALALAFFLFVPVRVLVFAATLGAWWPPGFPAFVATFMLIWVIWEIAARRG